MAKKAVIHDTAEIEDDVEIGTGTYVWSNVHIRRGVRIGTGCVVGEGVFIDLGVSVGDKVKIQNDANLYRGLTVEDGVFIGPNVQFANDMYPRAINPDGASKSDDDWEVSKTLVKYGASIGIGAIIMPGVNIGKWALVAAGALVTKDIPDYGLAVGFPAEHVGYVCKHARRLNEGDTCGDCNVSLKKGKIGGDA